MGLNIVLEASHNFNNRYGKDVWELANKVCNIIENKLIDYNCNIYRLDDINGNIDKLLYEKSKYLDELNPDIYLLINFNSDIKFSDKKGISVHASKNFKDSYELGTIILKNLTDIMKINLNYLNNYNIIDSKYSLCIDKEYTSVIINGPYVTNLFELNYINSLNGIDEYASSIYNSIIYYYNLSELNCDNILNIDDISNKNLLMNNYSIRDINGVTVAVEKDGILPLSILEKSNNSLNNFVVRRRFNEIDSEKIKTDDIRKAINRCNELFGYSVYSIDGTLIYKSNKGYTNIGNISKSVKKEKWAVVSKLGGAILESYNGENITLQLGTKIKVINIMNTTCTVEVIYENECMYGSIDSKYLNF